MTCATAVPSAAPSAIPLAVSSNSRGDDPAALGREITLLAGQINAANHRLLKLIARFDASKGWSGGGTVRSCAHWLNWRCGIDLGTAREKVRVAHCLASLPLIDAAFAAGAISYSKVRAMTRVATPENEEYLLMIARHGTASHLEQVVNKYRRVLKGREQEQEAAQQAARELVYYQDEQGMWVLHAKLPPEAGTLVVKAIEAALAREADGPLENVSAETSEPEPAALALRDQTCRVPGCCERRYVDAHHIVHWVDGGETSLDNLVTLCRHHHRALHNGDFSLRAEGAGPERRFIFTGKDGQVLQEGIFPQFQHVSAETSSQLALHQGARVTPLTCVPHWQGERCDYGMAIDGLLRRGGAG